MAKVVYLCPRHQRPEGLHRLRDRLALAARRLCPDNITPRPPRIIEHAGVLAAVFAPSDTIAVANASICAGHFAPDARWHQPGRPAPDGSFALFRADTATVEVQTDAVGSRSIYYHCDDQLFIAATSQRAITLLRGQFDFDPATLAWMVSNGVPGVEGGWDRAIRRLPPDAVLSLDRDRWQLEVVPGDFAFASPDTDSDTEPASAPEALRARLRESFAPLDLPTDRWILPLSGGYDSRGLLGLLPERTGLRTVTWGLAAARDDPQSDAGVAQTLAAAVGVPNQYLVTDLADEPVERLFERFVVAGEGGIDHVSAYLDGFAIWKRFFESGVGGVIRGDEAFGWGGVAGLGVDTRNDVQLYLWQDWNNLPPLDTLGLPPHTLPAHYQRRPAESTAQYRDRLWQQFRIPVALAALSDLKLAYVELANPLLARSIITHVRSMSDADRAGKRTWKAVVDALAPALPIAQRGANAGHAAIMQSPVVVDLLRATLASETARTLVPEPLRELVAAHLARPSPRAAGAIDLSTVAFRLYLVCRMYQLLHEDARLASAPDG